MRSLAKIRQIGGRGTVNAHVINDRVAWSGKRDGIRYSLFSANVIISDDEQPDADEIGKQSPLRRLPMIVPAENGRTTEGPYAEVMDRAIELMRRPDVLDISAFSVQPWLDVEDVGCSVVVTLFLLFAWRGYKIAINAPDNCSRLMAAGLTTIIVFQAIINIAVVSGALPVTGITLPFLSYGGTSLLFTMIMVGLLLNISRYSTQT